MCRGILRDELAGHDGIENLCAIRKDMGYPLLPLSVADVIGKDGMPPSLLLSGTDVMEPRVKITSHTSLLK